MNHLDPLFLVCLIQRQLPWHYGYIVWYIKCTQTTASTHHDGNLDTHCIAASAGAGLISRTEGLRQGARRAAG